ncbi:MAG: hypothetical protein M4579_002995 [Chaenotheca gracillima]|nr:MAG: hypothetical protein M4579_002995 [Chaenotheca gracillima]
MHPFAYYALAGLVFVFVTRKVQTHLAGRRFAAAHGCLPARRDKYLTDYFGIGLLKQVTAAKKRKATLAFNRDRFEANNWTFWTRLLTNELILTADPENLKAILATKFNDFDIGPMRLDSFRPLLGLGMFTADGPVWEHSRAMVRPNFSRTQIADLGMFEKHVRHLLTRVPKDGSTFDIQDLFFRFTMDAATEFLLGESVNSLDPNCSKSTEGFADAFAYAQSRLWLRLRIGGLGRMLPDKGLRKACDDCHRTIDEFVERAVDRRQTLDVEKSLTNEGESGRYVFLNELAKQTTDKVELRDQILNILMAGRDTTAALMSSTFFILARNEPVLARLRAEVLSLGDTPLTFEVLKNMKYLRYVLNEGKLFASPILRLHPVLPVNGRQANKDTFLPVGGGPDGKSPIFCPAGQYVGFNSYTLHRRKDLWGEDANEFRPERWEKHRPGWEYIPFNAGPRICLGQQYALIEASYTITRLLQEYGTIKTNDTSPWTEGLELTCRVGQGVHISLTK